MVISLHKLLPLLMMGGIAMHSKGKLRAKINKVLNKPREYTCRSSMKNILYAIQVHNIGEIKLDMGRNTREFIKRYARAEMGDPSLDPWMTPYRLFQKGNSIYIVSAGPDKNFGSKDDFNRSLELLNY